MGAAHGSGNKDECERWQNAFGPAGEQKRAECERVSRTHKDMHPSPHYAPCSFREDSHQIKPAKTVCLHEFHIQSCECEWHVDLSSMRTILPCSSLRFLLLVCLLFVKVLFSSGSVLKDRGRLSTQNREALGIKINKIANWWKMNFFVVALKRAFKCYFCLFSHFYCNNHWFLFCMRVFLFVALCLGFCRRVSLWWSAGVTTILGYFCARLPPSAVKP